jgi:two-component system, response regulator YesN
MIKVLIVDDEKIVRKGLISFMPWQDFGMTVVGEANNGENALQFIESNKVDLLVTDLSMPVMSGIELMREVKRKYPHIQIVVLTLHQNFEYVQEALRLGAIDYIAKTELEKEQFEDVLRRIASLMEQKNLLKGSRDPQDDLDDSEELLVLYALNPQSDELKLDAHLSNRALEADAGIMYWTDIKAREKQVLKEWVANAANSNLEYTLISFQGLNNLNRKSILQILRGYQKSNLFYHYDPLKPYKIVQSEEIIKKEKPEIGHDMNEIKEKWLSGEWIHQEQVFELLLNQLKSMRLPPIRLTRIFFSITDEWNRLYQQILPDPIVMEDFLSNWVQFEIWLRDTREKIKKMNLKSHFSIEIQNSIIQAMSIAQQKMNQPLTAGDIAKMVNMSSSYFSQCFKEIVGKTYTDYLRDIRMERAKEYLRNTAKTIQWIAEQVGYNDEKYFSRLFREHVGVLPSEYRQMGSKPI